MIKKIKVECILDNYSVDDQFLLNDLDEETVNNYINGSIPINRNDLRWLLIYDYDVSKVDTSNISDMSYLCWGLINFNQDISKWNTSKVIDMSYMFYGAENFNQDISKLDTSNVLIMDYMLFNAFSLNHDLSNFNISSCNSLNLLFGFRDDFPFNLSKWKFKKDVSAKFLYTFFDVNLDQIELIPEQCLNISNNPYENFITFAPYFYFDYDRLNDFDNKIIYPENKESECENTSNFFYNIKFTELAQLNFKLLKMNFIDSFCIPKNFLKNKTFKLMKANIYPPDSVDTFYFLSSENKEAFFISKEFVYEFLRVAKFNV